MKSWFLWVCSICNDCQVVNRFLYMKGEKMSEKLDKMNDNINQLILQSNESDKDIEIRVKAIETELKLQKETTKNRLTLVGIGLTVITIGINVLFNILK